MASELNHNKKNNPPIGDGWNWVEYQNCWQRFYNGRKRKTTTKIKTATKRKKKNIIDSPIVSPFQVVVISILIFLLILFVINLV